MDIDGILEMLNWNNPEDVQQTGLALARKVKCLSPFILPFAAPPEHSKNLWKNCAIVLCERSDAELKPYLIEIMVWMQDLNWPGAERILERLQAFEDKQALQFALRTTKNYAIGDNDDPWLYNLDMIDGGSKWEEIYGDKGNL